MKKKTVRVFAALTAAAVMMFGTLTVSAEGSYTTKSGDSLQKIAKEVYGDAAKWNVIYEANKDQIKNPNRIWVNQTLVVPGAESVTIETANKSNDTAKSDETTNITATDETRNTTALNVTADASTLLQTVYRLMEAQDYEGLATLYKGDEAKAYVDAMTGDGAIYIPDGSLTGKGSGIYKVEKENVIFPGFYFYYGDFVDGVRCGNGSNFALEIIDGVSATLYTGAWNNDAPNGQGTRIDMYDVYDNGYVEIFSGNLVNGLWNGTVSITDEASSGEIFFTTDHGVAEDKTDELLSHRQYYQETRETYLPGDDDFIMYAIDGMVAENEVINGIDQWYSCSFWYCPADAHLGIYGWSDWIF